MKISISLLLIFVSMQLAFAQVPKIKKDELDALISDSDAKLTVINFWATWCGPCIKELPYFEEINRYDNVKVLLVSLDFPQEHEKVNAFVKRKGLKSQVYQLDEKDPDYFLRAIDESWSGAIPATLMVNQKGKRWFFEKAFSREDLLNKVNERIN